MPTVPAGNITVPPAAVIRSCAASAFSTAMWVLHTVGGSGAPSGAILAITPATALPFSVQTVYPPNSSDPISPCQPNSSR